MKPLTIKFLSVGLIGLTCFGCSTNGVEDAKAKAFEKARLSTEFVQANFQLQCTLAQSGAVVVTATPTKNVAELQTVVTSTFSTTMNEALMTTIKSRLPGGSGGGEGLSQVPITLKQNLLKDLQATEFICEGYNPATDPKPLQIAIGIKPGSTQADKIKALALIDSKLNFPIPLGSLEKAGTGSSFRLTTAASTAKQEPAQQPDDNTQEGSPNGNN
jgi:hypothetical protein